VCVCVCIHLKSCRKKTTQADVQMVNGNYRWFFLMRMRIKDAFSVEIIQLTTFLIVVVRFSFWFSLEQWWHRRTSIIRAHWLANVLISQSLNFRFNSLCLFKRLPLTHRTKISYSWVTYCLMKYDWQQNKLYTVVFLFSVCLSVCVSASESVKGVCTEYADTISYT
jgi:hypothetical protein